MDEKRRKLIEEVWSELGEEERKYVVWIPYEKNNVIIDYFFHLAYVLRAALEVQKKKGRIDVTAFHRESEEWFGRFNISIAQMLLQELERRGCIKRAKGEYMLTEKAYKVIKTTKAEFYGSDWSGYSIVENVSGKVQEKLRRKLIRREDVIWIVDGKPGLLMDAYLSVKPVLKALWKTLKEPSVKDKYSVFHKKLEEELKVRLDYWSIFIVLQKLRNKEYIKLPNHRLTEKAFRVLGVKEEK